MELSDYSDSDSQLSDLPDHNLKLSLQDLLKERKTALLAKMEYIEKNENDEESGTPEPKLDSTGSKAKQCDKQINNVEEPLAQLQAEMGNEHKQNRKELVLQNPQQIIIQPPLLDSDFPPLFPSQEQAQQYSLQRNQQQSQRDSLQQSIPRYPSVSEQSHEEPMSQPQQNNPPSIIIPQQKQISSNPLQILLPDTYTQNQISENQDPPELGVQLLETNDADRIRSLLVNCVPQHVMEFLYEVSDLDIMEAFEQTMKVLQRKDWNRDNQKNGQTIKKVRKLNNGQIQTRQSTRICNFMEAAQDIGSLLGSIKDKMNETGF